MKAIQVELKNIETAISKKIGNVNPLRVEFLKFDTKISWLICRKQIEAVDRVNGWSDYENATTPAIALRWEAVDILQGLPDDYQKNYFITR